MKTFILFTLFLPTFCYSYTISGIDLRNGKKATIQTEDERPLVAFFLSSNCPCSQASFNYLNSIQKKYPTYQFVGINSNKTTKNSSAMKYYQKFDITFPVILDKKLIYANEFGALKTPHVFIKLNDKIVFQGGATNRRNPLKSTKFYLNDALDNLKNNIPIKITKSKTLGCYIRR
jgi:hypothetical protein